jgi:hypothetical protein
MSINHLLPMDNMDKIGPGLRTRSPRVRTDSRTFEALLEKARSNEAGGFTPAAPPVSKARLMEIVHHVRKQMEAHLMEALGSGVSLDHEVSYPGLMGRLTLPPLDSSNKQPVNQNIDVSVPLDQQTALRDPPQELPDRQPVLHVQPPEPRDPLPALRDRPPEPRGGQIDAAIRDAAKAHGVDQALVRSVIKAESGFNPNSTSPRGAMGLMQLMPETARELGVQNSYDPVENVQAGTRYLKMLLNRYDGDVSLALAAYNWGMGNLERRPAQMPAETRRYVEQVTRRYAALKA